MEGSVHVRVKVKVLIHLQCFCDAPHMEREHASREKKCTMVIFLIFVQINIYIKGFQKMKIRPLKGFEKMRFLCFYIIGV